MGDTLELQYVQPAAMFYLEHKQLFSTAFVQYSNFIPLFGVLALNNVCSE